MMILFMGRGIFLFYLFSTNSVTEVQREMYFLNWLPVLTKILLGFCCGTATIKIFDENATRKIIWFIEVDLWQLSVRHQNG